MGDLDKLALKYQETQFSDLVSSQDWLELSDNGNVTVAGLSHLRKLQKLKVLRLENLQGVSDRKGLLSNLKTAMPNCEITFDELKSSEML